jgi:EmrB/QacA subfamily drug resistance transporter
MSRMTSLLSSPEAYLAGPPPSAATPVQRRQVLIVMCLALVMVVANVSMLNVALRDIGLELGATATQQHWIVDSYAVAFAALLLPFGALGDRIGRRDTMLLGMLIMAVAAIGSALVDSSELLIGARVLAGVGAALIMPGTLSSITHVFPPEARGKAVGTWAGFASSGGIIGLLVAGGLLEVSSWPSIFWLTAALSALAFVGTLVVVPNSKDPAHANIDPFGSMLSVVGIAALVFGVIEGPVSGWGSTEVISALVISAIGLFGFVMWELHTERPVLDVRLFRNRAFGAGSLSIAVQFFAAFGFFYVSIQYLQGMLGYSPLRSAVALMPMGAVIPPLSAAAPGIAKRFGLKLVNAAGLGSMAAGFVVLALLNKDSGYLSFLPGLMLFGAGMALSTAPASESIVNSLPKSKHGVASAVNDTTRELGGALGIAVIGSAFTSGYKGSLGMVPPGVPPQIADAVLSSPIAGVKVAAESAPRLGAGADQFSASIERSFMDGFSRGMLIGAGVLLVGVLLVLWRSPSQVTPPTEELDALS